MQQTEALKLVGYLAGLSNGWTDDSIAMYAAELSQLDNYDQALAACQTVMRTWKETWKPPIGILLQAYNQEKQRKPWTPKPELGRGPVIPVGEGLKIAWKAYADECGRQGREPNRQIFHRWAKQFGQD